MSEVSGAEKEIKGLLVRLQEAHVERDSLRAEVERLRAAIVVTADNAEAIAEDIAGLNQGVWVLEPDDVYLVLQVIAHCVEEK